MDEKQEIRDFIIWYLTNQTDIKTLADYKKLQKEMKKKCYKSIHNKLVKNGK